MYAKLSSVKRKKEVNFHGPFIGGIAKSQEEAENMVAGIIDEQKGFAVLPKKILMSKGGFAEAKDRAVAEFKKMKEEVKEADEIINRPPIKRKKKN